MRSLNILFAAALVGGAGAFQVTPDPEHAPRIAFGRADDLIRESEKEWETTLENKFPHTRKFYDEVSSLWELTHACAASGCNPHDCAFNFVSQESELNESVQRTAKSAVEKMAMKPMWCDDAESWMNPNQKSGPF